MSLKKCSIQGYEIKNKYEKSNSLSFNVGHFVNEARALLYDTKESLRHKKEAIGLHFGDGKRKIDFVLVYRDTSVKDIVDLTEMKKGHKRAVFENNLTREGLDIEKTSSQDDTRGYVYVKIHAPFDVLCKYAQLMNIKMPIKEDNFLVQTNKRWKRFKNVFALPDIYKPKERHFFTCVFNRDYIDRFLIKDRETFFDNAKRSKIVHEILTRCKYDNETNKFGLDKLIASGAYLTAYPIHDGPYLIHEKQHTTPAPSPPNIVRKNLTNQENYYDADSDYYSRYAHEDNSSNSPKNYENVAPPPSPLKESGEEFWANKNDRQLLHEIWSNPRMFYKEQPIYLVRKYFGEKIAMYFAWLGFYTAMLVPPALLGIICFIYGLITMHNYIPVNEICDPKGPGNITMCPLCDELCGFWKLKDSCRYSKLTYLFDNPSTIVFAIFMSFWATFFLEFWKRKQNELAWDWDTKDFEEEEIVRPEYETQVKTLRKNPVTNTMEPYLPLYSKALRLMGAAITVLTFLVMVIGIVLGIIVYRLSVVSIIHSQGDKILSQNAQMTTNVSAAMLNLIAIMLLNRIYSNIAGYLTDLECPRTRSDYEDSYTVKMFLFQFVNYYSSLIYIAFFKGRYSGDPSGGGKLFGFKMEPCEPSGCMSELFIQFFVIMVGKQILNNCQELLYPVIMNWWRKRNALKSRLTILKANVLFKRKSKLINTANITPPLPSQPQPFQGVNEAPAALSSINVPQYQEDFTLEDTGPMGLFDEYLEMAIQYGFTTMFVAAFPLAPLFSLLNNVIEIRLDAFKYVTQFRRNVSNRAQDIGVWYDIIHVITKLAVITNAMIIAFTSDFIPKIVYEYHFSQYERMPSDNSLARKNLSGLPVGPTFTLAGYMNQSLSYFNLSYLQPPLRLPNGTFTGSYAAANTENHSYCRYRDYRIQVPPFSLHYKYWVILVTRLAFVIIFEHFVFFVTEMLAFLIPDMPYVLKVHLARQRLLLRGALYEYDIQDTFNEPAGNGTQPPKISDSAPDISGTVLQIFKSSEDGHKNDNLPCLPTTNANLIDGNKSNILNNKELISKGVLNSSFIKRQLREDEVYKGGPSTFAFGPIDNSPIKRDASIPKITSKTVDSISKNVIKSTRNL